jgi:uncharacterized protein (DUF1800 family)
MHISRENQSAPRMRAVLIASLLVVLMAPVSEREASAIGRDRERASAARHLLSRATWGIRARDLDDVLAMGADIWLERQLHPDRIDSSALSARLKAFPTTHMTMAELYRDFSPRPEQLRELQQRQEMSNSAGEPQARAPMTPEQRQQRLARSPARLLNELVGAKIQRAVHDERQLEDVMTDFWFNHFNVFFGKGQTRFLLGDYERTAIRPHVFGRFEDMLIATARHPAMLFYLDNWQSVHVDPSNQRQQPGTNLEQLRRRLRTMSPEQREALVRSGRVTREQLERLERGEAPVQLLAQRMQNRGLNENYARELLELHTLGVDGGYTQEDVVAVARAFTGWTFVPPNARQALPSVAQPGRAGQPGRMRQAGPQPIVVEGNDVPFVFRPAMHDQDEKVVIGRRLPRGRGLEDGLDVLRMLAQHPSTARHIARKLVERFVSDDPPPDLVDHLADVFLKTRGDLRTVTRALFTADAFYRPEYRDVKVKTPYELVVSALRVTRAEVQPSQRLVGTLRTMGHLPYTEPAPTGFPAASEDWINPGALLHRINFGLDLAGGRVDGVRIEDGSLADPTRSDGPGAVEALLSTILPGMETVRLAGRIQVEVEHQDAGSPRQRAEHALGLALGSPEFQRR